MSRIAESSSCLYWKAKLYLISLFAEFQAQSEVLLWLNESVMIVDFPYFPYNGLFWAENLKSVKNRCDKLVSLLFEVLVIPFFTSKHDLGLKNTICQLLMT